MDCKIIAVNQSDSSDEWLDLRRCRITASRMADVMAGKETKRYKRYLREKVKELLGHKAVEESPEWAQHGRENEPRALAGYEYKYEQEVEHDLFLISNQYDWLSASPDLMHLPDYLEGGEIKCRAMYRNYRKFRQLAIDNAGTIKACPACDRYQVMTAMWVTGFKRWKFVNYYVGTDLAGGMAQKIHRVDIPRDDAMIEKMEVRSLEFMHEAYEGAGLAE